MTQSIGRRLFDLWIVPNEFAFEKLPKRFQAKWNHAATELLRGVLTGEIPLPDELGPAAVQFIKNQELDEYRNFQAWMEAAKESGVKL